MGTSSGGRTRVGRPIFRVGRAEMVYCGQVIVVYCHGLQERRPTAGSAGVADFSGFRAVTFVQKDSTRT